MTTKHILVPIDFSEYSEHALDYAMTFASKLQACLTLLHGIDTFPVRDAEAVLLPPDYLLELEVRANRHLRSYLERLTTAGLKGEVAVVHGTPLQAITEVAKERQVDLIIMGTHGWTGFQHFMLGSVAERVVRHAPCPVLVVRTPAATAA